MTAAFREPQAGAVHASRADALHPRTLVRSLVAAGVVGGFLGFAGAFDTDGLPVLARTGLMALLSVVGALMGSVCYALAGRIGAIRRRRWLNSVAAGLLMFAPMGVVVWLVNGLLMGALPPVSALPGMIWTSLIITSAMMVMVYFVHRRDVVVVTAPSAGAAPKFLERLPPRLRGAEVWAVEAEDHYLRLHTSKGQDLILMRLADAIAELEGIEGAQTHRSWWVAREAIVDARRGDGRATLTLKDGAEVPVSRTYAGALRERGWI